MLPKLTSSPAKKKGSFDGVVTNSASTGAGASSSGVTPNKNAANNTAGTASSSATSPTKLPPAKDAREDDAGAGGAPAAATARGATSSASAKRTGGSFSEAKTAAAAADSTTLLQTVGTSKDMVSRVVGQPQTPTSGAKQTATTTAGTAPGGPPSGGDLVVPVSPSGAKPSPPTEAASSSSSPRHKRHSGGAGAATTGSSKPSRVGKDGMLNKGVAVAGSTSVGKGSDIFGKAGGPTVSSSLSGAGGATTGTTAQEGQDHTRADITGKEGDHGAAVIIEKAGREDFEKAVTDPPPGKCAVNMMSEDAGAASTAPSLSKNEKDDPRGMQHPETSSETAKSSVRALGDVEPVSNVGTTFLATSNAAAAATQGASSTTAPGAPVCSSLTIDTTTTGVLGVDQHTSSSTSRQTSAASCNKQADIKDPSVLTSATSPKINSGASSPNTPAKKVTIVASALLPADAVDNFSADDVEDESGDHTTSYQEGSKDEQTSGISIVKTTTTTTGGAIAPASPGGGGSSHKTSGVGARLVLPGGEEATPNSAQRVRLSLVPSAAAAGQVGTTRQGRHKSMLASYDGARSSQPVSGRASVRRKTGHRTTVSGGNAAFGQLPSTPGSARATRGKQSVLVQLDDISSMVELHDKDIDLHELVHDEGRRQQLLAACPGLKDTLAHVEHGLETHIEAAARVAAFRPKLVVWLAKLINRVAGCEVTHTERFGWATRNSQNSVSEDADLMSDYSDYNNSQGGDSELDLFEDRERMSRVERMLPCVKVVHEELRRKSSTRRETATKLLEMHVLLRTWVNAKLQSMVANYVKTAGGQASRTTSHENRTSARRMSGSQGLGRAVEAEMRNSTTTGDLDMDAGEEMKEDTARTSWAVRTSEVENLSQPKRGSLV
ncbi:unnamed protein product [Amoebophrya sp. A120]|nr:unnamed protein product [Amoebophrya sp. A120]|eukprot:GSA120T00012836001.1